MDLLALLPTRLAPALAAALLHSLWQDALLAACAALMLSAMARATAALRHTMAMVVLLAMVLVPMSTALRVLGADGPTIDSEWLTATPVSLAATAGPFVPQDDGLAPLLAIGWGLGAGLMLLRRFGGWRLLAALDRQPSRRLPLEWQARFETLRHAMGVTRDVAVRLSADVVGPFTAKLLRPVIWLPLSLLTQLPREQVEALLAHELAHIARMDWLWNGIQCVLEALLFFHPAAWWLGRRIRAEREHACDDKAVAVCGDAIALAEALAQLERQRHFTPHLVLAAQGGSLMNRITRLLAAPRPRARWGAALGTGVLVLSGVLLVAQLSFANKGPHAIRLRSTTDGTLGPGDSREVSAYGEDGWRHYTVSIDKRGTVTETLDVDGTRKPVTAETRRWVANVLRGAVPPAPPPVPDAPPPPPPFAAVPLPPLPAPPPEMTDMALFKTLMQHVAADPGVVAKLGSPVSLATKDVDGNFTVGGGTRPAGDADLELQLRGPKGTATVHVDARMKDGEWALTPVDFRSAVR